MAPQISVVIPTHNRARFLSQTLTALAHQSVPPRDYEVILVADGCGDNTVEAARQFRAPYALSVLEQPGRGAAVARNRGAEKALGSLFLFLDDDMEARPTLIEGHINAHRRRPGGIVLGYFPILAEEAGSDVFALGAKEWWDKRFAARRHPAYRFSFWDFCTGNVSMPAALFRSAGGFCEEFPSAGGEDWEFGVRLLKQGCRFRFAPDAESVHHGITDFDYALRRKRTEGLGHVLLVRRHPELFWCFNLPYLSSLQKWRRLWSWLWQHPMVLDRAADALRPLVALLIRAGQIGRTMRIYRLIEGEYYWQGVRRGLPTAAAWEEMMRTSPRTAPASRELTIDVVRDWDKLEDLLEQEPADAARFYFNGIEVGGIPALPGGERLSVEVVRHELLSSCSRYLLEALMDSRSISGSPAPEQTSRSTKALSGYSS
jgi:glycosyltransferase involved in cell wall biosynthesis